MRVPAPDRLPAVALADTLNNGQAAQRLEITTLELAPKIGVFEEKLCLRIFDSTSKKLALTEDERILIEMIREAQAPHKQIKTEDIRFFAGLRADTAGR